MNTARWVFSSLTLFFTVGATLNGATSADEAEPHLVAYYDFNQDGGGIVPDRSSNKNDCQVRGEVDFVRCGTGHAIKFNGGEGEVFGEKLEHSVIWNRGITIMAWVWSAPENVGDVDVVQILDPERRGAALRVTNGKRISFWCRSDGNRVEASLPTGGWHHVVGTFDWFDPDLKACTFTLRLYVDGELVASKKSSTQEFCDDARTASLHMGSSEKSPFAGMLDDVRLYHRSFPFNKVYAHFRAEAQEKKIGLFVKAMHSLRDTINVHVDFRLMQQQLKKGSMRIRMLKADSAKAWRERIVLPLPESGKIETSLEWGKLPSGSYVIEAAACDAGGRAIASERTSILLPERPEWLGSRAGVLDPDKVLAPWTPVQAQEGKDGIHVMVWDREYVFKDNFLDQITIKNMPILASPILLKAVVDGKSITWNPGTSHLVNATDAKATIERVSVSSDGALKLIDSKTVEYDGMIKMDWKIEAARETHLEKLVFEIPMLPNVAKYINNAGIPWTCSNPQYQQGRGWATSVLLPKDRIYSRFMPHIWLGDEEKGFVWICESDHNWLPLERNCGQEIVSERDRVIMRHFLIDGGITLVPKSTSSCLAYTFGLMGTPVKPMEQDCWDYRVSMYSTSAYQPYDVLTAKQDVIAWMAETGMRVNSGFDGWSDRKSYTKPIGHEKEFHDLVKAYHAKGILVAPFFGYHLSEDTTEWKAVTDELFLIPRESNRYPRWKSPLHRICLKGPWQDGLVDGIARLMDEYDIDGVYLDSTGFPCPCENALHGCGYDMPDGTRKPTYPIWAVRDTHKRIYTVVKTRKKNGIVDLHTGGGVWVPSLAWATSSYYPEHYGYIPRGHFALDVLPLVTFRAEMMGHQYGVENDFLCYGKPYTFEEAYAFTLLHDVPIRGYGDNWLLFNSKLWKLFDQFGKKQAKWLPYWRNGDYVISKPSPSASSEEGAYVSLYIHPQNGTLAVISNLTRETVDVETRFDFTRLGMDARTVVAVDALSNDAPTVRDATLRFPQMKSLEWKLIWLKPSR